MAKRLKRSLEGDAVKAMRIARTEGHRVQEKAKYDAVVHSNKKGVITLKEWNTMEDRRVRRRPRDKANHKKLNEVQKPMDEKFSDGLSSGPAPGVLVGANSAASNINCRCFLTYSIQRVEKPQYEELENMAFNEWKKERLRTT